MAISSLKKVYIIAPGSDKEKLLEELQKAALIHIVEDLKEEIEEETKEKEIMIQELEMDLSKADFVIDYLKPFERKLSFFKQMEQMEENNKPVTYTKLKETRKICNLDKIYDECYKLHHSVRELQSEENDLKNQLIRLEPYSHQKVAFSEIHDTESVRMKMGYIVEDTFKQFHLAIEDFTTSCAIYKIAESLNKHDYCFISYLKEDEAEIEKILTQFNFREEDLNIKGTVHEEIDKIKNRQATILIEKEGIEKESKLRADWLDRIRLYYDLLLTEIEKKKTEGFLYETKTAFIIKGWVKDEDVQDLKELVGKWTQCFEIIEKEPEDDEPVPIELTNPQFIQPMEMVTQMYSFPDYRGLDPTPVYFFFFLLFFGICLTDAGYGMVIAIGAFALLRYLKAQGQAASFLKLLIYGGVATVFAGLLTGGWFGIAQDKLPPLLLKFRWFDPAESALKFLSITFYLGIIETCWGLLVGAWVLIFKKKKINWLEAIEKLGWASLFAALGPQLVMTNILGTQPSGMWGNVMGITIKASFVVLFAIKAIQTFGEMKMPESTLGKITTPIITLLKVIVGNLLGIVKYIIDIVSNILSYSRLMALGLATGQIAMAVNIVAGLANEMIPVPINHVIALLVLIIGHTFNLAINTLGALVHTARLQYVEFFPLFFEGGGKPFKPFSVKTMFNLVTNETK